MSSWYDESGNRFWSIVSPALWSATKQGFASHINDSLQFLKNIKADFVRGDSDAQVAQASNGGCILQVVGSTPNGSTGYYRVLADRDDYMGTRAWDGFLNRYITAMGSIIFLATPSNALPSGPNEGLLISNILGSDSGDVKPILGAWYTGPGSARPIDGGSNRVFQKSGTYDSGDKQYNIAFYVGAQNTEDEGRLMLFEDAPNGVAFQLTFFIGPRCET